MLSLMYDEGHVMVTAIAPEGRLLVNSFVDSRPTEMSIKLSKWRSIRPFPFLPVGMLRVSVDTVESLVGDTPFSGDLVAEVEWARHLFIEPRYLPDWRRQMLTLEQGVLQELFTDWTRAIGERVTRAA